MLAFFSFKFLMRVSLIDILILLFFEMLGEIKTDSSVLAYLSYWHDRSYSSLILFLCNGQAFQFQWFQIHQDRILAIITVVAPAAARFLIAKLAIHLLGSQVACAHFQKRRLRTFLDHASQCMRQQFFRDALPAKVGMGCNGGNVCLIHDQPDYDHTDHFAVLFGDPAAGSRIVCHLETERPLGP